MPQLSSTYVVSPSHHETPTISFDAIQLGEHEDHPRIVRVRCRPCARGASLPAVIDLPSVGPPAKCIDVKHVVGGELLYPLQVWYCPTSSGSENRAIQRLTGGTARRSWKGGVLVMKCDVVLHMSYTDASLADIPVLAHFLVHHT